MKTSRVYFLITFLLILLSACTLVDSPEIASREWFEALLNLDGNKLLARTCNERQGDVQDTGLWMSIIGMLGQMFTGQQTNVDISDLNFDQISESGNEAYVHVYGVVRVAVLASVESYDVDEEWLLVKEGGRWKWCGLTQEEITLRVGTPTPTSPPRDLEPPKEEQEIIAGEAFNEWADNRGLLYKNAIYETISNENGYAKVHIVMEVWEQEIEIWAEAETTISLRTLGGWHLEDQTIAIRYTDKGLQDINDVTSSNIKATQSIVEATTQARNFSVGSGIIAYTRGTKEIVIIDENGDEYTFNPLSLSMNFGTGFGESDYIIGYRQLEISPLGDYLYFGFIDDRDESVTVSDQSVWRLDLVTGESIQLISYSDEWEDDVFPFNDTGLIISGLSVSPDGNNLAISLFNPFEQNPDYSNYSGSAVHIISPKTGDEISFVKLEGHISKASWSPDGNNLAVKIKTPQNDWYGERESVAHIINLDGDIRRIGTIPAENIVNEEFFQFDPIDTVVWSLDGNDIFYGGDTLGAINIESGKNVTIFSNEDNSYENLYYLIGITPDGNNLLFSQCAWYTWSCDGIWKLDLSSGGKAKIFSDVNDKVSKTFFSWQSVSEETSFAVDDFVPTTTPNTEDIAILFSGDPRILLPSQDQLPDIMEFWYSESYSNQVIADQYDDPQSHLSRLEQWGRIIGEGDYYLHKNDCESPNLLVIFLETISYKSIDGANNAFEWEKSASTSPSNIIDTIDFADNAYVERADYSSGCQNIETERIIDVTFQRHNVLVYVSFRVAKEGINEEYSEEYIISHAIDLAEIIDQNIISESNFNNGTSIEDGCVSFALGTILSSQ